MKRVIKFGDALGVGAVVETKGWFRTRTWTLVRSQHALGDEPCSLDKWVCRETGTFEYACAGFNKIHLLYIAQYNTRETTE